MTNLNIFKFFVRDCAGLLIPTSSCLWNEHLRYNTRFLLLTGLELSQILFSFEISCILYKITFHFLHPDLIKIIPANFLVWYLTSVSEPRAVSMTTCDKIRLFNVSIYDISLWDISNFPIAHLIMVLIFELRHGV